MNQNLNNENLHKCILCHEDIPIQKLLESHLKANNTRICCYCFLRDSKKSVGLVKLNELIDKKCFKCSKNLPQKNCYFARWFWMTAEGKKSFCDDCALSEAQNIRLSWWYERTPQERYEDMKDALRVRNRPHHNCLECHPNAKKCQLPQCNRAFIDEGCECCDCGKVFCSCYCMSRASKCSGQKNDSSSEPKPNPAANSNQATENYNSVRQKAQSWWSLLSSAERGKELSRLVENMKLGKYWFNNVEEGEGSGWVDSETWWTIQRGKFTSHYPHLVPIQTVEEFEIREFDNCQSSELMRVEKKDNSKPNPAADSPQNDNISPNPGQSSQSSPQILIKREDNSNQTSPNSPKNDNKALVISLKEIKKISLVGDNLVIEFNQSERTDKIITVEQIVNNQELSAVKNYLRNSQSSSVSQQELDRIINSNSSSNSLNPTAKKTEPLFWIGLGLSGILVLVGLSLLMIKIKKKSLKKK